MGLSKTFLSFITIKPSSFSLSDFIKLFKINLITGFVRVKLNQAKSVFLKKVEKRQAKSVFCLKI